MSRMKHGFVLPLNETGEAPQSVASPAYGAGVRHASGRAPDLDAELPADVARYVLEVDRAREHARPA